MLNIEGVLVLGFKKKAVFLAWRVFFCRCLIVLKAFHELI